MRTVTVRRAVAPSLLLAALLVGCTAGSEDLPDPFAHVDGCASIAPHVDGFVDGLELLHDVVDEEGFRCIWDVPEGASDDDIRELDVGGSRDVSEVTVESLEESWLMRHLPSPRLEEADGIAYVAQPEGWGPSGVVIAQTPAARVTVNAAGYGDDLDVEAVLDVALDILAL